MLRALLTTVEQSAGKQWSGKEEGSPRKALFSEGSEGYPKLHSPGDTSEAQHVGGVEVERNSLHSNNPATH